MSLRIEVNNITIAGGIGSAIPRNPQEENEQWVRIHEYKVGAGYTFDWLLTLYTCEPNMPIQSASASLGWVRIATLTNTVQNIYNTCFETSIQCAAPTNKMYTPRLLILPCGDGIKLTAGQGIRLENLRSSQTTVFRHWANFWGNADRST